MAGNYNILYEVNNCNILAKLNKTLKYLYILGVYWYVMNNIERHLLNNKLITNFTAVIILYECI